MPSSIYAQISPRSSLSLNGIAVEAGVIDSDFRSAIKVVLRNFNDKPFEVNHGDRIAQLIFHRISSEIPGFRFDFPKGSETARGRKGFGSTGRAKLNNL